MQSEEHIMYKSPSQRKVLNKVMWKTEIGISSFQSWLKKTETSPGFYQQDKAEEKLGSDGKKDEDNGLQKSDNKNIRFKNKPNKDLDHLVNSLEKDTETKENETKIKSEKFAPDKYRKHRKKEKTTISKREN